jgi:GNAT superfamily N-acetyltransferase
VNIEIRKANFEDSKKEIECVWRSCNWGWNDKEPERMASIFKNRWKNFVAFSKGQPVGYVGLISDHNVYALIVDMMVDPTHQKKGIGRELMKEIISECKSEDIKVIKLISSEKGKRLYESSGFDICPEESPGMILKLYEM